MKICARIYMSSNIFNHFCHIPPPISNTFLYNLQFHSNAANMLKMKFFGFNSFLVLQDWNETLSPSFHKKCFCTAILFLVKLQNQVFTLHLGKAGFFSAFANFEYEQIMQYGNMLVLRCLNIPASFCGENGMEHYSDFESNLILSRCQLGN